MADRTCTVGDGDWDDTATWGGDSVPGVNDKAIIPDASHVPLPPIADTTIHDWQSTNATFDGTATLSVSHTVSITGGDVRLKEQTTAGQAITLTSGAAFDVSLGAAGNVAVASGCTLGIAAQTGYSGTVTFAGAFYGVAPLTTGTVIFLSGVLITSGTLDGAVITCAEDALFAAIVGGVTLNGANITAGGDVVCFNRVGGDGIQILGTTFTGPGASVEAYLSLVNTDFEPGTISGFYPIIKIGAAAPISIRGDGEAYRAPPPNKILNDGTEWGTTDNPLIGTASSGGTVNNSLGLPGLIG